VVDFEQTKTQFTLIPTFTKHALSSVVETPVSYHDISELYKVTWLVLNAGISCSCKAAPFCTNCG